MKNNINNTGQNQKIPQLRFPEFEEEWVEKKLGDIADIKSGGTPNRGKKEYWKGNIPWVTTSLLNSDEIWETDEFITKNGLDNSSAKLFPINTILMAMYGQGKTRGMVSILKIEASTNQACAAIILNSLVDCNFVFQSLKNKYEALRNTSNEGGQKNLSSGLIRNFKFVIPNLLPEQTKIANFLTAVDKRINLLQKKKAQLEQYKKGVMQKLFSQEIRFKQDDGSDFPDWVEKKLGEVCENIGGSSLEKYQTKNGKYNFISIGNYSKNGNYIDNGQRINLNDKTKTGDIIGATIFIDENDKYIYNQRSERLICKEIMYPLFAWFFLNSTMVRKKIFSISQGGTQIYVNYPSVKELRFNFPKKEEQQKIANFLSSIDKSIEKLGSQIEHSQEWKQGLLQKMFV